MYSTMVIMYLFLGGAAGGVYFVVALWSLLFYAHIRRKTSRERQAFRARQRVSAVVALIILLAALSCLFFDLKLPHRALLLFLKPHSTAITFGSYALAAQAVVGILLVVSHLFSPKWLSGPRRKYLDIVCVPCSLAIMIYTGVYLALPATVPFWHTWTLVALFFASSLSSGICVTLLISYFTEDKELILKGVRLFQGIHIACLITEACALGTFLFRAFTTLAAAASVELLCEPRMLATGIVGVLGMGIASPLVMEIYALTSHRWRAIPLSDVLCLIGCFCLRFCIIACGAH